MRKIIHVDMDCFYAAIEMRDQPSLADKPVAVGGSSDRRGVICTANYIARQYGVRSAMATATAFRLCKDLVLLPVDMAKYRAVANHVHGIFQQYSSLVEPLSLDEAYLDVSHSEHHYGSATLTAQAIRQQIWQQQKLTASAGVAPNKFLAKIASGWKKPNGLFVIKPSDVDDFVAALPVEQLFGVGKVTAEKLYAMNVKTCADLQKFSITELNNQFGKLGKFFYEQCRGIDYREVESNRIRKSVSVEQTFPQDVDNIDVCLDVINELYNKLMLRIQESASDRAIKNQYIKIKFNNFRKTTSEVMCTLPSLEIYLKLFREVYIREQKPIRLLGLGVRFCQEPLRFLQSSLF